MNPFDGNGLLGSSWKHKILDLMNATIASRI